jgi:lipopolysaccharide biosynthesis glycosyltransferase
MNIVYSSSDLYAPIAGVSLYSLLESNRDADEINIYIIDNGISRENREKFQAMCREFGRNIEFYPIMDIEKLVGSTVDIGKWNISTFARLFEARVFPESVRKVIHVDCDTIVTGSLQPLWDLDMGETIVAGAMDCLSPGYRREIGLREDATYLNAGVIVLNLEQIRKRGIEEKFKAHISHNAKLTYVDQAVLNACLSDEDKLVVPLEYNIYAVIYYVNYRNLLRLRRAKDFYTQEQVLHAKAHPVVVHFSACFIDGSRPWMENNVHPMLDAYLDCKRRSPWAEEPLWPDNRGKGKLLLTKVIRRMPQWLMSSAVGVVHGVLVPIRNMHRK